MWTMTLDSSQRSAPLPGALVGALRAAIGALPIEGGVTS